MQAGWLPFDGNAEIERLNVVLEIGELNLHRKFDERIGVLPEELRAGFVYDSAPAKLNDADPQAWLADVLDRIADLPQTRLHELLPWHWKVDRQQALAA